MQILFLRTILSLSVKNIIQYILGQHIFALIWPWLCTILFSLSWLKWRTSIEISFFMLIPISNIHRFLYLSVSKMMLLSISWTTWCNWWVNYACICGITLCVYEWSMVSNKWPLESCPGLTPPVAKGGLLSAGFLRKTRLLSSTYHLDEGSGKTLEHVCGKKELSLCVKVIR